MFESKRCFMAAHLQHAARAAAAGRGMPETRIEEARIMHAKFACDSHIGHHLGRRTGWHADFLAACEDVEGAGVEDDPAKGTRRHRFPELVRIIMRKTVE